MSEPEAQPQAPAPLNLMPWLVVIVVAAAMLVASYSGAPILRARPLTAFAIGFATIAVLVIWSGATVPFFSRKAGVALLLPIGGLVAIGAWGPAGYGIAGATGVLISLLAGGSMLGAIVGSRIAHPGHILVVASVSTLADLYSVFHRAGLSAVVVENERALSLLAIPWAMASGSGRVDLQPVLGIGDVIMISVYLVVARRFAMPLPTFVAGFLLAFGVVFALLVLPEHPIPVPVLPFLGIAAILAHPRARQLRPQDRKQALIGISVLTLAVGALFALQRFAG